MTWQEHTAKNLNLYEKLVKNKTNVRDGLNLCMTQIESNEIAIKPADKGSIVAVMISKY